MAADSGHRIPVAGIALSTVASALLAVGIVALVSPGLIPGVSSPMVAWTMIAVGAIVDAMAMVQIIRAARRAQPT